MMRKYERYEKYKDSGIEWIGEIPEEWEARKLKFELVLKKGKNPNSFSNDRDLHPYLTMDYLRNREKSINYVGYNKNLILVEDNQILILWDGANAGEVIKSKKGYLSSTMANIFIKNNDINKEYLYFFLKSIENIFKLFSNGTTIPHFNSDFLMNYKYFFPPLETQNKIAEYLDKKQEQAEQFIAKQKKIIELMKEQKKAIINQAVTKGINPDVKMKESGVEWLGEIPEHWEVRKLKYVCKIKYGNSLEANQRKNGDIPVYGSNGIVGYHNNAITKEPCIIIGRKGSFGKLNYSQIACFPIDTAYYIDDINKKKYDYIWFFHILGVLGLDDISKDTGVPGLNREDAYQKYLTIPTLEEQKEIVAYIEEKTSKIDTAISKAEHEIKLTKEYMESLIYNAVTGQIRVD